MSFREEPDWDFFDDDPDYCCSGCAHGHGCNWPPRVDQEPEDDIPAFILEEEQDA